MNNFNNQFATQRLREEGSVTGTGANFKSGPGEQAGPIATKKIVKKKLKPEVKDVEPKLAAGKAKVYMKDKWGWKDAPSIPNRPSKGGFIYKQLFEELSNSINKEKEFKVGDKVKWNNLDWEIEKVLQDGDLYRLKSLKGDPSINVSHNVLKRVNEVNEANVPYNIAKFAKKKGASSIINTVAKWAEKAGKKIIGGTAIGKDYDTLVLDLTHQGSEIYINLDDDSIEVNGQRVSNYDDFASALDNQDRSEEQGDDEDRYDWFTNTYTEDLNESYSKFKTETKTRGKSDQFHQAVREVRKKVQEINRLFEYVSRLKSELSEGEGGLKYKVHTEKALEKIKEMVAQLNQNVKKFK